jgi:hypothetical protein
MSKEDDHLLIACLKPFDLDIQERVLWLREIIWDWFPHTNELIFDNSNALTVGWTPTAKTSLIFCSLSVIRSNGNVQFGFYRGTEISDPRKLLKGKSGQYRYLHVKKMEEFPIGYAGDLAGEAYLNAAGMIRTNLDYPKGQTIVKTVSFHKF